MLYKSTIHKKGGGKTKYENKNYKSCRRRRLWSVGALAPLLFMRVIKENSSFLHDE